MQRYFRAKEDASGSAVNYGVFVVAGEAAGLYARVQAGATDDRALSAPVLDRRLQPHLEARLAANAPRELRHGSRDQLRLFSPFPGPPNVAPRPTVAVKSAQKPSRGDAT